MNYRHHFHAGNFADVFKHVLLVRLIRAMQQKPKGFLYLDTHAGRGAYDLQLAAAGDSLARTPEWPDGVGRFWGRDDLPEAVRDYVALVRDFDRREGNLEGSVRFYPGSPLIARQLARPDDRLALCELHRSEAAALQSAFAPGRRGREEARVSVQEIDGYTAIRAMLPPPERRALVLIDPPFEAQDEFALVATALGEGLERFPSGVFAVWYPLTERARVQEFLVAVERLNPPPTLLAELMIAGDYSARKLKGCGLLIVNPPWKFDVAIRPAIDWLAPVLEQESGGRAAVSWLVPER